MSGRTLSDLELAGSAIWQSERDAVFRSGLELPCACRWIPQEHPATGAFECLQQKAQHRGRLSAQNRTTSGSINPRLRWQIDLDGGYFREKDFASRPYHCR